MKNILLTGVGGVTPQSIAKSLKVAKHKYRLIGIDSSITANGLYMNDLFDETYYVPSVTQEEYYEYVNRICDKEKIDLMIVSPDFEVQEVNKNRERLNVPLILPPEQLIPVITDKVRTYEYLSDTEYAPGYMLLNTMEDLEEAFERFGVPFWVRQYTGTSGIGSLKISSIEQAKIWIEYNEGWGSFMASDYLPGGNFGFQLIFNKGKLVTSACYERKSYVMGKVAPSGISGNAAFGVFVHRDDINKVGEDAVRHICRKLGIQPHSMLTVDIKEDKNGVPKVTEINPRHIAPTFCFTQAGINFAEVMVRVGLGQDVSGLPKYNGINPNYCLLRGVDAEPIVIKQELLEWKKSEVQF